jgi:hypothetical protein
VSSSPEHTTRRPTNETHRYTVNRTFVDGNPLSTIASIASSVETRPKGRPCALYVGVKYIQKSPKPVAGLSSPVARCVNNLGQMVRVCAAAAAAAYVYKYVCCVLDIYEIFSTLPRPWEFVQYT